MSTHLASLKKPSNPPQPDPVSTDDPRRAMNNMYRFTRHVYDASRKYYLLGRDVLIRRLDPTAGDNVCEAGCGTARNLRKMAERYPQANFYGFDASDEMLKTAQNQLKSNKYLNIRALKQGLAESFDPATLFDLKRPLDKIVFSYALSIIPPWKEAFDHAVAIIKQDGEIHIVDFGSQAGLPPAFRKFLYWWLSKFHVYYKPEILAYLQQLAAEGKGTLKLEHLYKGYAYYAVFKKN